MKFSKKQKLASLGSAIAVFGGLSATYAFVVNPNPNTADVALANTGELPFASPVDYNLPHLQPGESNQIMVRVTNTTEQTIVVNGIAGGSNTAQDPPGVGQPVAQDYCPGGSITIPDIGLRQNGSGVAALTPLDPADGQGTWATDTDTAGPTIPTGDTAVFLMAVTFNNLPHTAGDDPAVDPNNQTGCMYNGGGTNNIFNIALGDLYYTAQ